MTTKKRNPFLAAFLSLLVSGLGQIYNGQLGRGLIFWLLTLLSGMTIFIRFPKSYEELIFILLVKLGISVIIIIDAFWVGYKKKEVQQRSFQKWYYYLLIIIFHLGISTGLSQYISSLPYKINTIQSPAMEPTILLGDRFITDFRTSYKPRRGDIVLVQYPQSESLSVGRIVGSPSEKIEGKNGVIFINDVAIKEPYVKLKTEDSFGPITLGPNKYFIMGDNRAFSFDSRNRGPVDVSLIYGEYLYKIKFLSSNE